MAQINLLAAMCRGNNVAVIETLQSSPGTSTFGVEISFEVVMCAISDNKLRASYPEKVAAFIELLKGIPP